MLTKIMVTSEAEIACFVHVLINKCRRTGQYLGISEERSNKRRIFMAYIIV